MTYYIYTVCVRFVFYFNDLSAEVLLPALQFVGGSNGGAAQVPVSQHTPHPERTAGIAALTDYVNKCGGAGSVAA